MGIDTNTHQIIGLALRETIVLYLTDACSIPVDKAASIGIEHLAVVLVVSIILGHKCHNAHIVGHPFVRQGDLIVLTIACSQVDGFAPSGSNRLAGGVSMPERPHGTSLGLGKDTVFGKEHEQTCFVHIVHREQLLATHRHVQFAVVSRILRLYIHRGKGREKLLLLIERACSSGTGIGGRHTILIGIGIILSEIGAVDHHGRCIQHIIRIEPLISRAGIDGKPIGIEAGMVAQFHHILVTGKLFGYGEVGTGTGGTQFGGEHFQQHLAGCERLPAANLLQLGRIVGHHGIFTAIHGDDPELQIIVALLVKLDTLQGKVGLLANTHRQIVDGFCGHLLTVDHIGHGNTCHLFGTKVAHLCTACQHTVNLYITGYLDHGKTDVVQGKIVAGHRGIQHRTVGVFVSHPSLS